MSYTNGTTHYNLPLTQGSDKRDWSDTNQAFEDLDAAVYQASSDATGALSAAQSAQTTANSAATDAASAISTANAASASAATASETASLARTEAQSAQSSASSALSTAQSAAAQASNADTVALQAQGNIGNMNNLNTQTKASLVAAINEVLSQIGGGMKCVATVSGTGDSTVTLADYSFSPASVEDYMVIVTSAPTAGTGTSGAQMYGKTTTDFKIKATVSITNVGNKTVAWTAEIISLK